MTNSTRRSLAASVYLQTTGIAGVILIDRFSVHPAIGIPILIVIALGGWLLLAGPVARRAIAQWWRAQRR